MVSEFGWSSPHLSLQCSQFLLYVYEFGIRNAGRAFGELVSQLPRVPVVCVLVQVLCEQVRRILLSQDFMEPEPLLCRRLLYP